jgi:type IV pilus assembly protein PilC
MPTFSYSAIDARSGCERRGTLEGATAELVVASLKSQGLAPMSLVIESGSPRVSGGSGHSTQRDSAETTRTASGGKRTKRSFSIGPIISGNDLAVFTRQLATLVKAGMPLLRCLEVLGRQEKRPAFKHVLREVGETIRSGGTFSDGLLQHPAVFDRLYVNMVKAGEAGGMLEIVLDRLARFMEKNARIKSKVKAAMTYPVIVLLLAVAIVGAMMVFVVPRFEQIFTGLLKGQPLPPLTRVVLGISYFIKDHSVLTIVISVTAACVFAGLSKSTSGRRVLDRAIITVPVFGELVLKASIARFSRTFGTLLSSGVPILQALVITRDTSGNVHIAEAIDVVHNRVKEGDGVAGPLESTHVFPDMVTSMIEVGEETGSLPEMLVRIADTYDEEVDNAVAGLTSLIEPIMIVGLAILVGGIVIALFLPIISIIQHLQ